jgi:hypothetical protein
MKPLLNLVLILAAAGLAAPVAANQSPAPAPAPAPAAPAPGPAYPAEPTYPAEPAPASTDLAPATAPPPGMVAASPSLAAESPEAVAVAAEPAPRAVRPDQMPYLQGSKSLTLTLGSAFIGSNDYFILGVGFGVYVLNGLEVGVDGAIWLFDSPTIGTVTPQVRYVVWQLPIVKPYIGAFYRHYFVGDDVQDFDSVGARVGVNINAGSRAYFGFGGLYEHVLDCNENVLECDDWYPEAMIGLSF